MSAFILDHYAWIKALHVISVIAWMAGLLYLPRLFVYHCDAPPGSPQSETFKIMERRLLRAIMNPAMFAVWIFGTAMLWVQDWSQAWLHAKVVLISAMTVVHHVFALWRKDFAADRNTRPARTYRIANEIPTVLMIAIVIVVIVKPF
ncbi:MAG: protoporphyrinogen oxidase HemJ [Alphaproteobacteria bacterium]|nr:protoporphyrinogen oxidase HemJ [Alphaproteobacteria bacterium]